MTEHYTKKKAGHCIGYAMECLRNVCRKVLRGGYLPPAPNFMLLSRGLSSLFSTFFKKSNKITQIGPKNLIANFKNFSVKGKYYSNMLSFALGLFRISLKRFGATLVAKKTCPNVASNLRQKDKVVFKEFLRHG